MSVRALEILRSVKVKIRYRLSTFIVHGYIIYIYSSLKYECMYSLIVDIRIINVGASQLTAFVYKQGLI